MKQSCAIQRSGYSFESTGYNIYIRQAGLLCDN